LAGFKKEKKGGKEFQRRAMNIRRKATLFGDKGYAGSSRIKEE